MNKSQGQHAPNPTASNIVIENEPHPSAKREGIKQTKE